jgi:hypothetical protein
MKRPIRPLPLPNSVYRPVSSKLPVFGWADPTSLLVEGEYQRGLTRRSMLLIRRIAENFDWLHVKPPVCAREPGGKLCIVDGQHTAIAAASRGITKIPIMIIDAKEIASRAKAFVAHNTDRLNVTPTQLWHSRLAAGDAVAKQAHAICLSAGVTPVRAQPAVWKVGDTVAFNAIGRLVERRGKDDAIRALKALVSAKRAPVMAHEILAVDAVLYDDSLGYDGPVFDLVTVIRSKSAADWIVRVRDKDTDERRLWRRIAAAWIRGVARNA